MPGDALALDGGNAAAGPDGSAYLNAAAPDGEPNPGCECCGFQPPLEPCCTYRDLNTGFIFHDCGRRDYGREWCCSMYQRRNEGTTTRTEDFRETVIGQLSAFQQNQRAAIIAATGNDPVPCADEQGRYRRVERLQRTRVDSEQTLVSMNGPSYQLSPTWCEDTLQIPVSESRVGEGSDNSLRTVTCNNTSTPTANNERRGDVFNLEYCYPRRVYCWPTNAAFPDGRLPNGSGIFIANSEITTGPYRTVTNNTRSLDSGNPGDFVWIRGTEETQTVTEGNREYEWIGEQTRWTERLNLVETIRTTTETRKTINYQLYDASGGLAPGFGIPATATQYILEVFETSGQYFEHGQINLGFGRTCETNEIGPDSCLPVSTECNPGNFQYILGTPCPGAPFLPVNVALPRAAVRGCGTLQHCDALGRCWCYVFDPNGPFIDDPASSGAVLRSDIIYPDSGLKTCCECSPGCPKVTLATRPEWECGQRDASGVFRRYDPFVAGQCCCGLGDIFRLVEGWSTLESLPGGSVERFDFVDGALPGDFVRGFRRDAPDLSYLLRLTVDGQFAFNQPIADMSGPIGCEWDGPTAGAGNVANFTFDKPLFAEGTHTRQQIRFVALPIPVDNVPNADARASGGWACMYYRIGVTCTTLTAEGEWIRGDDFSNPSQRIRAKQVWFISSNPDSSCTGGCVQSGPAGPTIGPTAITPSPSRPRGCASCGQSGGL